jgi:hypothetical protein
MKGLHERRGCAGETSLEVSANGWVRGLFQGGGVAGNLVVTLQGRPVESYVRAVGTNGCLLADFVRGTAVTLPGPGTSGYRKSSTHTVMPGKQLQNDAALFARY